jgi:hypothetical protein
VWLLIHSVSPPFHRIKERIYSVLLKRKVCVAAVASSMSQKSSMPRRSNPSIHGRIYSYAFFSTRCQIHVDVHISSLFFSPCFQHICMKLNTVSRKGVLGMFRISTNLTALSENTHINRTIDLCWNVCTVCFNKTRHYYCTTICMSAVTVSYVTNASN